MTLDEKLVEMARLRGLLDKKRERDDAIAAYAMGARLTASLAEAMGIGLTLAEVTGLVAALWGELEREIAAKLATPPEAP